MTPLPLLRRLLRNRNAIFLLALAAGLFAPALAPLARPLVLPALALAMAVSTMAVGNDLFRNPRALLMPALLGVVMNYILLGNLIIVLAASLIGDDALWTGFVLLATVPPAIAVIPFSGFLHGNLSLALLGTVGAYLGALVVMPVIAIGLLGAAAFDPAQLLAVILQLILLPLAVSRLLIRERWRARIEPYRGGITNWSFFVVLYAIVGLNRATIFGQTSALLPIVAIAVASMFLLGFAIDRMAALLHVARDTRTSLVLLGTLKNQGMAGGIALAMFGEQAALPAAVFTIVMIVYFIWLDFQSRRP